jgi:voltage-gated sodium channel
VTRWAQQITASKPFHQVIVAVIVGAGVIAGLETSREMMARHGELLLALDKVILSIFILEAVLKMAAHGRQPWRYFADGWNVFDFLIIVICLAPVGGPFAAVLRLARALRLLRLVSALPKLQLLVGALLKSLSAMGYVSLLLALLFYIYAVAGIHLFGAGDPQNFGSLGAALLSLFRIVTLDNWSDLYNAQAAHVPTFKVLVYFATFIVFGTMIILNLFIGIIMNSMSEMHAEIAARDRGGHEGDNGGATLEEDLRSFEQELKMMQGRVLSMRCRAEARRNSDAPASHQTQRLAA